MSQLETCHGIAPRFQVLQTCVLLLDEHVLLDTVKYQAY